jgi:hypothetical protein
MIRWMLRIALIVGTFFATSWVTFLLIGGFFWDAGSVEELNAREFPTPQDWLGMITYTVGIVSAVLVAFETKSVTRQDRSTDPE